MADADDRRRHRAVHVDELEAIPGPGTLTWHPVRAHLGVRAFGTNAYSADQAGHDVVEPHSETGTGHEELYFVARGRATFTIDGETFDAPAGTYVLVPDPEARRHATAAEPGTTVLSFGGPPDFEPSAWEWIFRARALVDADPDRARDVVEEGLRAHPDDARLRALRDRLAP
jgi:mannose-6-phosphate isomerase-like protein (cupin superfamily)